MSLTRAIEAQRVQLVVPGGQEDYRIEIIRSSVSAVSTVTHRACLCRIAFDLARPSTQ